MEQELISKKELLELTGISYGQLYRWKRKHLIPEDWFIRKSTYTGQETFFPKQRILARIDKIKHMKDDLSLDELADVFSPASIDLTIGAQSLIERNIVTQTALQSYTDLFGERTVLAFEQVVIVYLLDQLLRAGTISLAEGHMMMHTISQHIKLLDQPQLELLFLRKMGISSLLLVTDPACCVVEPETNIVTRLAVAASIGELKLKLNA